MAGNRLISLPDDAVCATAQQSGEARGLLSWNGIGHAWGEAVPEKRR
jgi:hypothetical protein